MDELKLDKYAPLFIEKIEDVLQTLYNQFRAVKVRNDYLREENEKLKSDAYKDEELSKMKSEYEKMKDDYFRGFPISGEEDKKVTEWIKKQMEEHPGNVGAIGGRFTYQFTPTGVGTFGTVIDSSTGDKLTFQEP